MFLRDSARTIGVGGQRSSRSKKGAKASTVEVVVLDVEVMYPILRHHWPRGNLLLLRIIQQGHELIDRRHWDVAPVIPGDEHFALEIKDKERRGHHAVRTL